ncbi:MAG: cytochrome c-type biogenesis protein [Bryobacteraceae bacterium]
MSNKRMGWLFVFLLPVSLLRSATDPVDPAVRIRRLEHKLMAPCCYQTTLDEHHSDAANEMKAEIAAWVAEGKSDREIIETYKVRYGSRILAEPEGATGAWLRVIPVIALLAGLCAVVLLIRRWRQPPPA